MHSQTPPFQGLARYRNNQQDMQWIRNNASGALKLECQKQYRSSCPNQNDILAFGNMIV